jgi:hypothetical protein
MVLHDVTQGSPEWHVARLGKMTASHAHTIAVAGKGLSTYCRQIAGEIYRGHAFDNHTSEAMQIGREEEDFARKAYEWATGHEVQQVGFAEHEPFFGASPDGLIGLDGGVEFKRKTDKCHNDLLLGAVEFELEYIWQCHANMLVFDRDWWDLCSYNPGFKDRSLFILSIRRSKECDEKLLSGIEKGKQEIKEYLTRYKL